VEQQWTIAGASIAVVLWRDQGGRHVILIRRGWPEPPSPRALILAEVYRAAVTGELPRRTGRRSPEVARWRWRALVEAGLVPPATTALPPLPPDAPSSVVRTWGVIRHLLSVRRLEGEAEAPMPLSAPFLARWARGVEPVTEGEIAYAKSWLRERGLIQEAGEVPSRRGRPLKLWKVAEAGT
jgi:hypothetical protein